MSEVKRTERGWAGHFIMGSECRFRRNTLLEYNGQSLVVSTVGGLPPRDELLRNPIFKPEFPGFEEIGLSRFYETMAFLSKEEGAYTEADVGREISIHREVRSGIYTDDMERGTEAIDNLANDMHEGVVQHFVDRLLCGGSSNRGTIMKRRSKWKLSSDRPISPSPLPGRGARIRGWSIFLHRGS